jgi:hypothetical protein
MHNCASADPIEQVNQGTHLMSREPGKDGFLPSAYLIAKGGQKLIALRCDAAQYLPPVLAPGSGGQPSALEAVYEAGDAGRAIGHALRDSQRRKAGVVVGAENPQNLVLLEREVGRLQDLPKPVLDARLGAPQC